MTKSFKFIIFIHYTVFLTNVWVAINIILALKNHEIFLEKSEFRKSNRVANLWKWI